MLKVWGRANFINVQKVLNKTPEYRVLNPDGPVPTTTL
jgi:hypothetical protein